MHSINLTSEEFRSLVDDFGPGIVQIAIYYVVREERNEEWQMLNDGITDESMVRSHCGMHQGN